MTPRQPGPLWARAAWNDTFASRCSIAPSRRGSGARRFLRAAGAAVTRARRTRRCCARSPARTSCRSRRATGRQARPGAGVAHAGRRQRGDGRRRGSAGVLDLFVGVGKSEVGLHASGYLSRPGTSVLAELRAELARLGLARQPGVSVFEDHLGRDLRSHAGAGCAARRGWTLPALREQRRFFDAYVAPWVPACCTAITQSPVANYYRRVAEFTDSSWRSNVTRSPSNDGSRTLGRSDNVTLAGHLVAVLLRR